ncbi:MAG: hypothetical protein EA422_08640 [Gemmatimonadales bacterium]|nr:MAG: hypothetical protein EA422_08640 [Gemmatimonadales bacterium]
MTRPRLQGLTRLAFLALLLIVVAWDPQPVSAQTPQDGYIVVLDPAQWTGEGVRSVPQTVGQSLRIRGLAYHPSGIASVHVNGHRAVLTPVDESGLNEFIIFLPVVAGTEEAFFVAAPREGSAIIVSHSLELLPADEFESVSPGLQRLDGLGRRWAVVVGISEYDDPAVPALRFAHRDAEALRDFLVSESAGLGGYQPENVVLLTNEQATFRNIRTALRGFLTTATEDDQIVFYFAGHGVRDPTRPDEYYLLTHDTEFDNLAGTALPMSDLEQSLASLNYRDLILIADACHSGEMTTQVAFRDAFAFNNINEIFQERFRERRGGEVVFTAGEGNDLSQEGERWGGGHGVFTYHLIEGLRGAADLNRDGIVDLGEVMEYVRDRVRRDTRGAQNPAIAGGTFDRHLPMAVVPAIDTPDRVAQLPEPAVEPEPAPEPVADEPAGTVEPDPSTEPSPEPVISEDALPPVIDEGDGVEDEVEVREVEEHLFPPDFQPGGALARGLLVPGLGQWHTERRFLAVLVAGVAGGAAFLASRSDIVEETRTYELPFGGSYQDTVVMQTYPHRELGVGVAAAAIVAGAVEAYMHARGRHEAAGRARFSLEPTPHGSGRGTAWDVGLRLSFTGPGLR